MRNPSRHLRPASVPCRRGRHRRAFSRMPEELESRCLLSTAPANLFAVPAVSNLINPLQNRGGHGGGGGGGTTNPPSPPSSYTPAQVRAAYGFDQIAFPTTGSYNDIAGTGVTIAIVDAYHDPNITSDLAAFSTAYGLPQMNSGSGPAFSVYYVGGGSNDHLVSRPPASNSGWATEISLDVEWAHAMAPQANIQLFEAAGADYGSLLNAIDQARYNGAQVVSMSFGGGEWSGETAWDDARFTSYPAGWNGGITTNVTFVASSGDSGSSGGAQWPAVSPNVVGVGGTTLTLTNNNTSYGIETTWSGSGGGQSVLETEPSYQYLNSAQSSGYRQTPDVSYDADPSTGFAVYDTYLTSSPWAVYGGTSAGAPQWSALIAIADQGRMAASLSPLDGATQTLSALYSLGSPSSSYHDITKGSNGYSAAGGYDMATGLGTPVAQYLVNALVNFHDSSTSSATSSLSGSGTGGAAPQVAPTTPVSITPQPGSQAQVSSPPILIGLQVATPAVANSITPTILIGPANLPSTTFTSNAATAQVTNISSPSGRLVPTAVPTTSVWPPRTLVIRPTIDREARSPWSSDDKTTFPAPGPDFNARDEAVMALDLLAIARNAEALGRVAGPAEFPEGPRSAPLRGPILTDLSLRDTTPALDPVLASAVVVLGGVLALRTNRSGTRRQWALRPMRQM